mmetsp:Transcript_81402/g.143708  ORF Transcript_81402/g.143708 Transcript_81402/m.143708 type:complete len:341 (-) Transcript_81402:27-1049(-)
MSPAPQAGSYALSPRTLWRTSGPVREGTKALLSKTTFLRAADKSAHFAGRENFAPAANGELGAARKPRTSVLPHGSSTIGKALDEVTSALKATQVLLRPQERRSPRFQPLSRTTQEDVNVSALPVAAFANWKRPPHSTSEVDIRPRAMSPSSSHRDFRSGAVSPSGQGGISPTNSRSFCFSPTLQSRSLGLSPDRLTQSCKLHMVEDDVQKQNSEHDLCTSPIQTRRKARQSMPPIARALSPDAAATIAAVQVAAAAATATVQREEARRGRLSCVGSVSELRATSPGSRTLAEARLAHKERVRAEERSRRFSVSIADRLKEVSEVSGPHGSKAQDVTPPM